MAWHQQFFDTKTEAESYCVEIMQSDKYNADLALYNEAVEKHKKQSDGWDRLWNWELGGQEFIAELERLGKGEVHSALLEWHLPYVEETQGFTRWGRTRERVAYRVLTLGNCIRRIGMWVDPNGKEFWEDWD
jgi:hypothetical protein